jgi:GDP/UDP-N,N'-diacetylbacillosamine 2-epimerase (hydrolysing)
MKLDFFSGKRGGFGAMLPLIKELQYSSGSVDINLIVTDQHLDPKFGRTIKEVEKYGITLVECSIGLSDGNSALGRIQNLTVMTESLANHLHNRNPDLIVLYGDRTETLFAASTAAIMNIPIAHLQGGDRSGSVDDIIRHSITKLASLHYVSCEDSASRVIKLGEATDRVINVGDSHVDAITMSKTISKAAILDKLELGEMDNYCVLLQHPETTNSKDSECQIKCTLEALSNIGIDTIAIYPCSDPGHEEIISAVEVGVREGVIKKLFKNLEFGDFLNLCRYSRFLIGNSSSGIIESAYLAIPAINIGRRQLNRLDGGNVLHVQHDTGEIIKAIEFLMDDQRRHEFISGSAKIYGDGFSFKKISADLLRRDLKSLLPKLITY